MLSAVRGSLRASFSVTNARITSEIKRNLNTSQALNGKRNFRKFPVLNKRGSRLFKETRSKSNPPEIPWDNRGVRAPGIFVPLEPKRERHPIVPLEKGYATKFVPVPEMAPELIVPDLKNCNLKPYVSYKVKDIFQPEFKAEHLFDVVYSEKITADFKSGKLDGDGQPLNPSPEEKLTPQDAFLKARQTGSDIFVQDPPDIMLYGKVFKKSWDN